MFYELLKSYFPVKGSYICLGDADMPTGLAQAFPAWVQLEPDYTVVNKRVEIVALNCETATETEVMTFPYDLYDIGVIIVEEPTTNWFSTLDKFLSIQGYRRLTEDTTPTHVYAGKPAQIDVFVSLHAGLANQLFELAAGINYAIKYNGVVKIDPERMHPAGLNILGTLIQEPTGSSAGCYVINEVVEAEPVPLPPPPPLTSGVILVGFFQHMVHMPPREVMLQHIHFDPDLMASLDAKYANLFDTSESETVAIHIRRGDYLYYCPHEVARMQRYLPKALEQLGRRVCRPTKIIAFSDDPAWVKDNYPDWLYLSNHGVVAPSEFVDLYLMSRCKHHLLTNSTFGWFGAYLSRDTGVTVVPYPWLTDRYKMDIYPPGWVKVYVD